MTCTQFFVLFRAGANFPRQTAENVHQITRSVSLSNAMILRFAYRQTQAHSSTTIPDNMSTNNMKGEKEENELNANKMRQC